MQYKCWYGDIKQVQMLKEGKQIADMVGGGIKLEIF